MRHMRMLSTLAITAACLLGPAASLTSIADDAPKAATGAISGKVVDQDGKAVADATVKVMVPTTTQFPPPTVAGEATTDKAGAFKVSGLNDGKYLVTVSTADNAHGRQTNVAVAGGKETALSDPIKVEVLQPRNAP